MTPPDIFQYDFMIRAFIAGGIIALVAPIVGCFLLMRRYALFADALSHVTFLTVAIALLAGLAPLPVSVGGSMLAAVLMEKLRMARRLSSDTSLAVFLSGSLALGLLLYRFIPSATVRIEDVLFGSILAVSVSDLVIMGVVSALVLLGIVWRYRVFFLIGFDEQYAASRGIRVARMHYLFMSLAAVTIAITMSMIGVLLLSALMIIPALAAFQLRKSFLVSIGWSVLFALCGVWIGITAAYYANIPAGPAMVIIMLIIFGCTALLRQTKKIKRL